MATAAAAMARRRDDRARLAELHRRVLGQELGAIEAVRTYLATATCDEPADLRYLLRVIGDAGMLGAGGIRELIAEALRALEAVWVKQPKPGLLEVCQALEECREVEQPWREDGRAVHPAQEVVLRTMREVTRGRDLVAVLRRTTHGVAGVRGKHAASHAEAKAEVYRRVLARLGAGLRDVAIDPATESARLLRCLGSFELIRLVDEASCEPLEQAVAAVLARPAHERPDALEQALLADPVVEELFATRDELAQILASWG